MGLLGPNIPSGSLSLAREGIFLVLSKKGRHSIRIYIREDFPVAAE
jgi:hypothetical protein